MGPIDLPAPGPGYGLTRARTGRANQKERLQRTERKFDSGHGPAKQETQKHVGLKYLCCCMLFCFGSFLVFSFIAKISYVALQENHNPQASELEIRGSGVSPHCL